MRTAVVVSGGDAPGINALVANFVRMATGDGHEILGAEGGFPGLMDGQMVTLDYRRLIPWVGQGGSMLPSSRDPVLKDTEAQQRIREVLKQWKVDNILLFGGNGTLRHIPPLLQEWGISSIGIPTTIDNDVPGSERSLGFDSACNFAYHAIGGALATAHALVGRIFLVETLGGVCGNLALAVAHGAGAHSVLLPEYAYADDWLAERTRKAVEQFGHALIVICEGARGARTLADDLAKLTGIRVRDVRLGHAQRGGVPSHVDRVLAADFAYAAYTHLKDGLLGGALVVQGGEVRLLTGLLPQQTVIPDKALYDRINGSII
jgi:6-phosphofructokinase 1